MIAKYGKFEYALAEHYRFEDELGRGAMGTVYRAKDMRLGRPVAIKMLHPLLTNELGAARFQTEIRIAAGLHHPNIIGVHDCGEADGRLYYVMDYLGGETLRDRLNHEKQLSVEEALGIVEQVADGLQYAHDHGVMHRDIKPENILLAEGRACIVDFGLARALGDVDTQRLTASGLSVGTPHYLSPEQAAAEKDVGPRADQYGLACVLYEMLAGEPPFTGPTATSIAMRHITEQPKPLRVRRQATPIGVEAAVMRALEKVPADRFATVREFAHATRRTSVGVEERQKKAQPPSRFPQHLRRRGVLVSLAIIAALSVGAAVYVRNQRAAHVTRPSGLIRVALLPLVSTASADRARASALVEGTTSGLRMFDGIVGVGLPSPLLAEDVEDDSSTAIAAARGRGARYVALLAGLSDRAGGINIKILDTKTGASFGRGRVSTNARSDDASTGADVAVEIARAIASRDSLFALGLRSVLASTRSAQAIAHLVEGQRRFGTGDAVGASTEFRRALAADSTCVLAMYRQSVAAAWDYHYVDALALADSGLRRVSAGDDRMLRLLRAQRFFVMRMTDSAVAGFAASVADDPDNVDGWFGLAHTIYLFGWVAGYSIRDSRASMDRVLYLDSAFAPIHHFVVDVALATGDTAAAKTALRRIDVAQPWSRAKQMLVRYATGGAPSRDSVWRELPRADQYTLSELVLQFSRTLRDVRAADRVATEMQSSRRSPESRRRGAQYRVAFSTLLAREPDATRVLVGSFAGDEFDPWLGAAALSGAAAPARTGVRKAAWAHVPRRLRGSDVADPDARLLEVIDFLVQDALDDPSTQRAQAITHALEELNPADQPANPSIVVWKESLGARIALSHGDTLAAIAGLQRALRRINEPYAAFVPLTSAATQRRLLATLFHATNAPKAAIDQVESSFQRSWSIADALYAPPPARAARSTATHDSRP